MKKIDTLLKNKTACAEERASIRTLVLDRYGTDIFPFYAGSLFLSAIELAVKSSYSIKGLGRFLSYTRLDEVHKAISTIPVKGCLKIKVLLVLFKLRCYLLVYLLIFIANKIGIKLH